MVLGCLKVAIVSLRNSPPVFKIRHATYEVDLALVATLPFSMRWFGGVSPQQGRGLQVGVPRAAKRAVVIIKVRGMFVYF